MDEKYALIRYECLAYYKKRYEKGLALCIEAESKYYKAFQEIELRYRIFQFICCFCEDLKGDFLSGKAVKIKIYNKVFEMLENMLADQSLFKQKKALNALPQDCHAQIKEYNLLMSDFRDRVKYEPDDGYELYLSFIKAVEALTVTWISIREKTYKSVCTAGKEIHTGDRMQAL